jgi:hypothetical protein
MATVTIDFTPLDALPFPRTGSAPLDIQDGGIGDPHMPCLLFDAAADEFAQFLFAARRYGSGNLTVKVRYSMASATSGNVVLAAQIRAITPGDAQDVVTDTFAAASTVTDAVPGTGGQMKEATITITNLDAIAADDMVTLQIYRDADNASDTATGDLELLAASLSYSDV